MLKWGPRLALAIAIAMVSAPTPRADGSMVAIVGATVIDGTGRAPIANGVVVIAHGRIAAVGSPDRVPVPKTAEIIDVRGKWLIPGLIDAHIHFFQSAGLYTRPDVIDLRSIVPYAQERAANRTRLPATLARYLASGVTGVVDVGGPLWNFEVREQARQMRFAPQMAVAGPLIATYAPDELNHEDPPIVRVTTAGAARAEVRRQLAFGSDLIKIWFIRWRGQDLDGELAWIRAAIDEAHRGGVRVAVHATELETARAAVHAGADVLVHSVEREPVDAAFLALLRAKGVIYTTTLGVYEGYMKVLRQRPRMTDIDRRIGDAAVIDTFDDLAQLPESAIPGWVATAPPPIDPVTLANLERVQAAGIVIAAGTDAGNIGTLHGPALHREMELMAEAG